MSAALLYYWAQNCSNADEGTSFLSESVGSAEQLKEWAERTFGGTIGSAVAKYYSDSEHWDWPKPTPDGVRCLPIPRRCAMHDPMCVLTNCHKLCLAERSGQTRSWPTVSLTQPLSLC
eukprot:SAG11_NODE_755_length_7329_cov_6.741355_3_plen_118_part_00